MKNSDSMKRMKAMAEAVDRIMKEQEKQKAQEAAGAEDDDMDLAADMLMEAADLIEDAADLLVQAASLLKGEEIEADCCFPCCVVEVFCDDEL
jgi:hypothetical protein